MSKFFEFEPDSAFPIAEQTVDSAAKLLEAFRTESEFIHRQRLMLAKDDKGMSDYLNSMRLLRERLGHYKEDGRGYDIGVVFGFELLKEQFDRMGLVLGATTPDMISAYFKELVIDDNPDSLSMLTYHQLEESKVHMLGDRLTPKGFFELQQGELTDANRALIANSRITFRNNSWTKVSQMWDQETRLRDRIPVIKEITGSEYQGFAYGLADFYWPHQIEQTIGPYAEVLDSQNF